MKASGPQPREKPAPPKRATRSQIKPAQRRAPKNAAAGISDEAVRRATGQGWDEWFRRLDAFGACELAHPAIAAKLREQYRLSGWWSQNVTGQFERARGRRVRNQACDGSFSTNSSKTIAAPLAKLYVAWADARTRAHWLPGATMKITTANENKSMRVAWEGGSTRLSVDFLARGAKKCAVAVGHDNLPSAAAVKKMKAYWLPALERLKSLLER